MSKAKKAKSAKTPLRTFQEGSIVANVYRGNIPDGSFPHLYYETGRVRKNGNVVSLSQKLYGRDAMLHCTVVTQAAKWIDENPEAADEPGKNSNQLPAAA